MLRLTITPTDPTDFEILDPDEPLADPILDFAAEHIGDADSITFEVVYVGFESSPDVLTVNRSGQVSTDA